MRIWAEMFKVFVKQSATFAQNAHVVFSAEKSLRSKSSKVLCVLEVFFWVPILR